MDGNPVPRPQTVDVLYLDIGERIDAIVQMNNPGVWVFGSTKDDERNMGLGVVVVHEQKWAAANGTRQPTSDVVLGIMRCSEVAGLPLTRSHFRDEV
jgi:FtsP/CotA-like multicopper oxidase with cupredoxin domain